MLISLEKDFLERYPGAEIGFLVAQVTVTKRNDYVERLKGALLNHVLSLGLNATNFAVHPDIALWRRIYEEDFFVKAKTYRSSIESLLRRVVTGKELWNICNVVDLYNCCSIFSLLPMGGYDMDKVSGNIKIRHAQEGETFLGLGERSEIEAKSNQIVYADEKQIICWLWNHKDAAATSIADETKNVLFFIDSFDNKKAKATLEMLTRHLEQIQGSPFLQGILNSNNPMVKL